MTLSVIIVNFRNPALLRLSLRSLARELSGAQYEHEVIVVDSASSPETRNVVREEGTRMLRRISLVPFSENTGYTRGVNEGLRRARGEYMLILNPDIVPTPGSLGVLMAYLRDHPLCGLAGPGLLNFDDTRQDSAFRFYTPLIMLARRIRFPGAHRLSERFVLRDVDLTSHRSVDWLMGSALMVRRDALERIGMMDEQFFLYLSEVDWAWRFWENAMTVDFVPGSLMYHYHRRESKGRLGVLDIVFRPQARWHAMDAIRYFKKHGVRGVRPTITHHVQPTLLTA
jgi:hypothetical protein